MTVMYYVYELTGPDLQIQAWLDHYACVVETGLATRHWSGKSEGFV